MSIDLNIVQVLLILHRKERTVLTHCPGERVVVSTVYTDYVPFHTLNIIINDELTIGCNRIMRMSGRA
jgi:hypothetical protein